MKRNYLYYLLTILLLAVSCEKDEMACTTAVETQEVSSIAATTAQCGGIISSDGNPTIKEAGVEWCTTSDFESNVSCASIAKAKLGKFACEITNLKDNTQYYVRAYARNSYGTIYGEVLSFKTLEIVLPAVLTDSVTNITISSATVGGEVTDESNGVVAERGVVYSTNPTPTVENNKVVCGRGKGAFTCNLTDLQDGVTYYVRAYAVNEKGTAYGEEKSFQTIEIVVPTVTTSAPTDITISSATVGGEVTEDGYGVVTERGVVYSTNPNPTVENNKVVCGRGKGAFTCNLTDLQDGVTYYVRAYAVNQKGTAYGEEKSFTTKAIVVPTVTTSSATSISYTSATVGGTVTDDGGATVTERGVVYSTTPNPTTSNSKVVSGSGVGSFTCNLSNLQDGVTYYVRAYAANEKGTAYGEEKSFTTTAITVPTVITSSVNNISYTSATIDGTVTDDGGATVTERGVVYSTTPNPTTSNSKVVSGSGKGSFTCNLNDLQVGTAYYVRAYAINEKGTAYGEEKSFTTKAITLPTVITSSVNNISYTSATIDGTVTDDGGATVTERGVVYSTTPNPTTSNSKVVGGSGKGAFTCNLSNLQDGVTYYVRAYAVNQKGTAYGEQQSFMTKKTGIFSVSSSKQVLFSSGNLQYHPANNKWRFAENQTDYVGDANANISSTYNGWLDLFGWSTGATNFGVSTSEDDDYYSGSFVDWGTNKIGNDAPNTWRTLTYDEWYYLRRKRPNYSELCGVAQVNGVNGLILLPDNWTCPAGVSFKQGFHSSDGGEYYAAYQTFTVAEWSKLEAAGAVFLPAAGRRLGSEVHFLQSYGYYQSATKYSNSYSYILDFNSNQAFVTGNFRVLGQSVRLVKDLQ